MADPNSCSKDLIEIFSAFLTPTIAIAAICIGWLQWQINKARLKHELFERRWEQFTSIREYLSSILIGGKVIPDEETKFIIKTRGCRFIFGSDIENFVDEIYKKGIYLHELDEEINVLPAGKELTDKLKKRREIRSWIENKAKTMDDRFSEYLEVEAKISTIFRKTYLRFKRLLKV